MYYCDPSFINSCQQQCLILLSQLTTAACELCVRETILYTVARFRILPLAHVQSQRSSMWRAAMVTPPIVYIVDELVRYSDSGHAPGQMPTPSVFFTPAQSFLPNAASSLRVIASTIAGFAVATEWASWPEFKSKPRCV